MRVLTRRVNQIVKIGDEIEVVILEVRGDQIRLGVRTPRNMMVLRKELYLGPDLPDEGGEEDDGAQS